MYGNYAPYVGYQMGGVRAPQHQQMPQGPNNANGAGVHNVNANGGANGQVVDEGVLFWIPLGRASVYEASRPPTFEWFNARLTYL